ncbi:MAG: hypothetical protein ACLQCB_07595 [Spirochaetia bacterium]
MNTVPLSEVDYLVTDSAVAEGFQRQMSEQGVEIIVAQGEPRAEARVEAPRRSQTAGRAASSAINRQDSTA